jgi:hypothetical protein
MQHFRFLRVTPGHAPGTGYRILGMLMIVSLLVFFPAHIHRAWAQTPQPDMLLFDPLTAEEREVATRVAEDNARVKALLGSGRHYLVSVELATPKMEKEGGGRRRHAEVLYYRYKGNHGVLALVDLGQRTVREVTRITGDAVPLVAAEVNDALALALQNTELTKLLGPKYQEYQVANQNAPETQPNRVEALRLLASSKKDPCYQHRCLSLLFRQGDTFLTGTSVIVDLTAQTVRVEQPGRTSTPSSGRKRK